MCFKNKHFEVLIIRLQIKKCKFEAKPIWHQLSRTYKLHELIDSFLFSFFFFFTYFFYCRMEELWREPNVSSGSTASVSAGNAAGDLWLAPKILIRAEFFLLLIQFCSTSTEDGDAPHCFSSMSCWLSASCSSVAFLHVLQPSLSPDTR